MNKKTRVRDNRLTITIPRSELAMIREISEELNISQSQVIVKVLTSSITVSKYYSDVMSPRKSKKEHNAK